MAKCEIKGLKELIDALNRLPEELRKSIAKDALPQALEPIAEETRAMAPVHTGMTRDAVKVTKATDKKGYISASVRIGDKDYQGSTFYASFLVYPSHRGNTLWPGDNFILRATDMRAQQAFDRFEAIAGDAIEAAWKKG